MTGAGPSAFLARRLLPAAALAGWVATAHPAPVSAQVEPPPIPAGLPAAPGSYDTGLDALHYDVELALSDDTDWIRGRLDLRLRATRPEVQAVVLDFTGLAVLEVLAGGRPAEWSLDRGRLTITLGSTLEEGSEASVTVEYRGVPDDGLILGRNVEGRPSAFVDNWPNRTRFWLPSVDHPSDKATARITVHAPEAWSVVANGRLVDGPRPTAPGTPGPEAGPSRTWTWATEVPHPTYTLVVGAAEMVVTPLGVSACGRAPASTRPDGCIESTTWLYPGSAEAGSRSFRRAVAMVDFFAGLIGPFPFEKMAHVQSATRFGGMENSSAIFYAERPLAMGADMEGTVSHEIAHQWFGDSVTPSDWSHLWLSEGFATYFGHLFFERADGAADFRRRLDQAARAYFASPDTLLPVVNTGSASLFDLLNRNSYQKGGWVLHMLRGLLGDEAFFSAIREYYHEFRDGNADSADFQAVAERVSGTDLTWFFTQWLYEPGYPVLTVEAGPDPDAGDLQVTLRQVQGPYAPRFRLPLTLEFRSGESVQRRVVTLEGETGSFTFPDVPRDSRIVVDPDGWVLMRLAGGS